MPEIVVRKRDNLKALVDQQDYRRLLTDCVSFGTCQSAGRQVVEVVKYAKGKTKKLGHLHRYLLTPTSSQIVLAKNKNYLDCRRENLQVLSRSIFKQTQKPQTKNAGDYPPGVILDRRCNKYIAKIKVLGKTYHLGTFATPELASDAYERAIYETYYGEVALVPNGISARLIASDVSAFADYCARYIA
jgi:hypothetical protein